MGGGGGGGNKKYISICRLLSILPCVLSVKPFTETCKSNQRMCRSLKPFEQSLHYLPFSQLFQT